MDKSNSDQNSKTGKKRIAWRRKKEDQQVTSRLGQRIRKHRKQAGLSIKSASDLTGVPGATLSRIENNKMTPTFPVLLKLLGGLRLPWAELTSEFDHSENQSQNIDISTPKPGQIIEGVGYSYSMLHPDSRYLEQLQPIIFDVETKTLEGAGGLRKHHGIEFAYVLSGTLLLYFEGQEPRELTKGGSALFNCNVPHAYVSKGTTKTTVLNILSTDPLAHREFTEDPMKHRIT